MKRENTPYTRDDKLDGTKQASATNAKPIPAITIGLRHTFKLPNFQLVRIHSLFALSKWVIIALYPRRPAVVVFLGRRKSGIDEYRVVGHVLGARAPLAYEGVLYGRKASLSICCNVSNDLGSLGRISFSELTGTASLSCKCKIPIL